MTQLHATPYDTSSNGFYFDSYEQYIEKSNRLHNSYGQPVEEFEIQFIDGNLYQLFDACCINQCNLKIWFERVESLSTEQQIKLCYRCEVLGDTLIQGLDKLDDEGELSDSSLMEYIYNYVDDIDLFDNANIVVQRYFDYEAYAQDLVINGEIDKFSYQNTNYVCFGF
mgnify:FL=1